MNGSSSLLMPPCVTADHHSRMRSSSASVRADGRAARHDRQQLQEDERRARKQRERVDAPARDSRTRASA